MSARPGIAVAMSLAVLLATPATRALEVEGRGRPTLESLTKVATRIVVGTVRRHKLDPMAIDTLPSWRSSSMAVWTRPDTRRYLAVAFREVDLIVYQTIAADSLTLKEDTLYSLTSAFEDAPFHEIPEESRERYLIFLRPCDSGPLSLLGKMVYDPVSRGVLEIRKGDMVSSLGLPLKECVDRILKARNEETKSQGAVRDPRARGGRGLESEAEHRALPRGESRWTAGTFGPPGQVDSVGDWWTDGDRVPVDDAPVLVKIVAPKPPPNHIRGRVLLNVLVGTDGRVERVSVARGVPELNRAAIEAVRQYLFKPAMVNHRPVAYWVMIPVDLLR